MKTREVIAVFLMWIVAGVWYALVGIAAALMYPFMLLIRMYGGEPDCMRYERLRRNQVRRQRIVRFVSQFIAVGQN